MFWRWMAKLADVLVLSLLWLLCSVPIVTVGAATAALYDAAARCVRGGENGPWGRFLRTFRAELSTAIPAALACGLPLLLFLWIFRWLRLAAQAGVPGMEVLSAAYLVVLILPVGTFCWMFPLLSRFTFRPLGLLWTAFQLALAHLPSTVMVVLLTVAVVAVSLWLVVPIFFAPCLLILLWSLFMEPVFRRHAGDREG